MVVRGLALALALSLPGRAVAAPPNVRLSVERAPNTKSCMGAPELEAAVEERVQRRVFDADEPAELTLSVRFSGGRPWSVDITLADALSSLGARRLTTAAEDCSALDDSLALVVALLVNTPGALVPRGVIPPEAPGSQPKPAQPESRPPLAVTPAASLVVPAGTLAPRAPFRFDARVTAEGSFGILPSVAPGVELALGLKPPRGPWLRALGELYGATERGLEGSSGGVRVSLRRLGLEVCLPFGSLGRFFEYSGCVGQRIGQLRAEGVRFDAVRASSRPYYSLVAGGQGLVPFGSTLGLLAGVDVELPLTRDRFTARPDGAQSVELERPSPLGLSAKLGLRLGF